MMRIYYKQIGQTSSNISSYDRFRHQLYVDGNQDFFICFFEEEKDTDEYMIVYPLFIRPDHDMKDYHGTLMMECLIDKQVVGKLFIQNECHDLFIGTRYRKDLLGDLPVNTTYMRQNR